MPDRPLIVTALLDEPAQRRFDDLRRRHFPPELNHLDAHLTLFHHLPGVHEQEISRAVADAARLPAPTARVTGVRLLGRGVALTLVCSELSALRRDLARTWDPWLTRQDRGKNDLHVTVQNKVTPSRARALHDDLAAGFEPYDGSGAVALPRRPLGARPPPPLRATSPLSPRSRADVPATPG